MAKNTLTVTNFINCAAALPVGVSVLIRANHGVGKSQITKQLARKFGFKDEDVIDRRLSQQTEGDMIGLPSTDGEVTRFNPPDWVKSACLAPKFLFLDEINRATTEVMQAAFQLVLDRELNGWKLHPETRVYAAVNTSSMYTVNEMDPALIDRFWVIDLEPTVNEWLTWAKEEGKVPEVITDFIAKNDKWLDPPAAIEPGSVHPSRRSWDRLGQALTAAGLTENPSDAVFYQLSMGFCGLEAAIAFTDYSKNYDFHVDPADVVNKWNKVGEKVKKMGQEKLNSMVEKVSDWVIANHGKKGLTEKQGTNVGEFVAALPAELRISFWSKATVRGIDDLALTKSLHKHVVKHILDVFGVPMGSDGIGVTPNIPGFLDKK